MNANTHARSVFPWCGLAVLCLACGVSAPNAKAACGDHVAITPRSENGVTPVHPLILHAADGDTASNPAAPCSGPTCSKGSGSGAAPAPPVMTGRTRLQGWAYLHSMTSASEASALLVPPRGEPLRASHSGQSVFHPPRAVLSA